MRGRADARSVRRAGTRGVPAGKQRGFPGGFPREVATGTLVAPIKIQSFPRSSHEEENRGILQSRDMLFQLGRDVVTSKLGHAYPKSLTYPDGEKRCTGRLNAERIEALLIFWKRRLVGASPAMPQWRVWAVRPLDGPLGFCSGKFHSRVKSRRSPRYFRPSIEAAGAMLRCRSASA